MARGRFAWGLARLTPLAWGANELGIEQRHTADQSLLAERFATLPAPWRIAEPFRGSSSVQEERARAR